VPLPEFTSDGELPPGIHPAQWPELTLDSDAPPPGVYGWRGVSKGCLSWQEQADSFDEFSFGEASSQLEVFENAVSWSGCLTETNMIQNDDQMLLAQQCIDNLRRVLLAARKTHSPRDYTRMAEPILLEIQQRDQDILEYLSTGLETPLAS